MGQFELKAGASCSWLQNYRGQFKGKKKKEKKEGLKVIAVLVKDAKMTAP